VVDRIQEIVQTLPHLDSVTGVWDVADRRHAQGDTAFPADLGVAPARRYGGPGIEQVWQYGSVFDLVLRRSPARAAAARRSPGDRRLGGGSHRRVHPRRCARLGRAPRMHGAYGRPGARQSLAGLSGAGRDASAAAVEVRE
jgi:hypothetical protein